MMKFFKRFFRREPIVFSTFWQDYNREQIERIRRGEPIQWLMAPDVRAGTAVPPLDIVLRSQEIDRLNARLDEEEAADTNQEGEHR